MFSNLQEVIKFVTFVFIFFSYKAIYFIQMSILLITVMTINITLL